MVLMQRLLPLLSLMLRSKRRDLFLGLGAGLGMAYMALQHANQMHGSGIAAIQSMEKSLHGLLEEREKGNQATLLQIRSETQAALAEVRSSVHRIDERLWQMSRDATSTRTTSLSPPPRKVF